MKLLILALTTVFSLTIFSAAAFAQQGLPPGSIPGHDQIPGGPNSCWPGDRSPWCQNDPWGRDGGGRGDGRGGGDTSCAPEVVEGNVAATERTLKAVSTSAEFKNAATFRAALSKVKGTADQKVAKYFALIGIDSKDKTAVADFVGAREVRAQWLSALERSSGLTSAQADVVAAKLQATLRGDLH